MRKYLIFDVQEVSMLAFYFLLVIIWFYYLIQLLKKKTTSKKFLHVEVSILILAMIGIILNPHFNWDYIILNIKRFKLLP